MEFVNSLGETTSPLLIAPLFLDRTILKARDPPLIEFRLHEFAEIEDMSSNICKFMERRCFRPSCFEPEKLNKLKTEGLEDGVLKSCTSTFEDLWGFVRRARAEALQMPSDKKIKLLIAVDGRSRFEPPIQEGTLETPSSQAPCCAAPVSFWKSYSRTTFGWGWFRKR